MKRTMKFFLAAILAVIALTIPAFGAREVFQIGGEFVEITIGNASMVVNGQQTEIDPGVGTKPEIRDGRTFLPVRAIVEAMGGTVEYNSATKGLVIKVVRASGTNTAEFWINSTNAVVNGAKKTMDVAPYVSSSGRTMLPLKYVGEYLGADMVWNAKTRTATLLYQSAKRTPIPAVIKEATLAAGPWSGVWTSDNGTLILEQKGSGVSGICGTYQDETMAINGTFSGDKWTGQYIDNGETVRFELALSSDGKRFEGVYYNDNQEAVEWSGNRVTDTAGTVGDAWGGVWFTDYGPMILTRTGDTARGVYQGTGLYRIEGAVKGDVFSGTIDEGDAKGVFSFRLMDSGKTFSGEWKYDDEEEMTEWLGTKKK